MVQRLGLCASSAGGTGSIPGRETKIPQTVQYGEKKKRLIQTSTIHNSQDMETT